MDLISSIIIISATLIAMIAIANTYRFLYLRRYWAMVNQLILVFGSVGLILLQVYIDVMLR